MQSIIANITYTLAVIIFSVFIYLQFNYTLPEEVSLSHYQDIVRYIKEYPQITDNPAFLQCYADDIIDDEEFSFIYDLYLTIKEDSGNVPVKWDYIP